MSDFSRATAVELIDAPSPTKALYSGTIDPSYWIVNGPNGGFIAALIARAARDAIDAGVGSDRPETPGRLRPAAITLHYLAAPEAGSVDIDVVVRRVGRRVASVSVAMTQHGRVVVHGVVGFVAPDPGEAVDFHDETAPAWVSGDIPPPPAVSGLRETVPMRTRYDTRPVVGGRFLALDVGEMPPTDIVDARAGGFIRPTPPQPIDEIVLVALSDAWWPPIFERFGMTVGGVPTFELTVHIEHPLPLDDDFVAVEFVSSASEGGFTIEDGRIWERTGRQLARSRQIAIVSSAPPLSLGT